MDPLNALSSLAGIVSAADAVVSTLGPYIVSARDAPKVAAQLSSECLATQAILSGLEQLISDLSSKNTKYASLIKVDQLIAVLTDGVLIFSELEAVLQTLPSPGARLFSPMLWVWKKGILDELCLRLQSFKISINCILSILQSNSQVRAEGFQQDLLSTVETLLERNQNMYLKMASMDRISDTRLQRQATIQSISTLDTLGQPRPSSRRSFLPELAFDHVLAASRVYRRARRDSMDRSIRSSIARTHAWSMLSGISLSSISAISVIALPLYVEDIVNPQHYKFGKINFQPNTLVSTSVFKRSIYHECVEVQLQLSQLPWFIELHEKETRDRPFEESPLSTLINIFRRGTPLLTLLGELDKSQLKQWKQLTNPKQHVFSSQDIPKTAIVKFIDYCSNQLNVQAAHELDSSQLIGEDTTNHVKFIQIIRLLITSLIAAGVIKPVVLESTSLAFTTELGPASLAIHEFLCGERLYLSSLETQLDSANIVEFSKMLPLSTANQLFASIEPLVDAQRKFLIQAEILALKPHPNQSWQPLFFSWSQQSRLHYTSIATAQKETKEIIRDELKYPRTDAKERQNLLREALAVLGLPSQRLEKYKGFLEELYQHGLHHSNDIKLALYYVERVKAAATNAIIPSPKLNNSNPMICAMKLNPAIERRVLELGNFLISGRVHGHGATESTRVEMLYLHENGLLHTMEVGPDSRIRGFPGYQRPNPTTETKMSLVQIIAANDIVKVTREQTQELQGWSIEWVQHLESFSEDEKPQHQQQFFGFEAATKIDRWMKELETVRNRDYGVYPSSRVLSSEFIRKYRLVPIGNRESGKSKLWIQFALPRSFDVFNPTSEDAYRRSCSIDGQVALLDVLDKRDQKEHPRMIEKFMRAGDGFILVYSITNRDSFAEVKDLQQRILHTKNEDICPMILVGNNCSREAEREVPKGEGEALAKELGCKFIEADPESGINIEKIFFDLVREIRAHGFE